MVELKEGIILGKKVPKEPISFSFEKGIINYIPFNEAYKFNFLKLKDQALDKGEFFIDGVKVYPDENSESSLFILAVNSLVKVYLCFLVEKKNKKEKVKSVQDELIKLRELPMNTDDEKNAKIAAIFEVIAQLSPSYVLVNLNEEDNQSSVVLSRLFDKYLDSLLFIVLNQKPVDAEEYEPVEVSSDVIDLTIGTQVEPITSHSQTKKKPAKKVLPKGNEKFGSLLLHEIKTNITTHLAFIIPTIGVIAFMLLSPIYAKTDNKFLLIPFIITIVICFFLYMLMTYRCSDFEDKQQKYVYIIINSVCTLIGYALGFVIYILFKSFDNDLSGSGNNVVGIILSIVFVLILMTAVLYLRLVVDKIKPLFKKKK